ncbi:MAG: DUF1566 domain-containing protein [Spirochaetes bacterium]|nr:DUF1566 domain-containing protein [Spirochaetota bacterium]
MLATACSSQYDTKENLLATGATISAAIAPTQVSSTPAVAATAVATCVGVPCTGQISIVFSASMNTALTQTLTTAIYNGTDYSNIVPNAGTTYAWSTTTLPNDTLTVATSWYWFPENSQIQYTLATSGLQDVSANAIAAPLQGTFTTTAPLPPFAIPDSGQTLCYDNSASIACTGSGGAFPNQDADFANMPAARSYVGPTLSGASDYTTTDNTTGLIWKSCSEGLSGAACATGIATTLTWYQALNQCAALNSANVGAGYASKKKWRLPTQAELESLTDISVNNPAINTASFPATQAMSYWSSTTYAPSAANAWQVSYNYGYSFDSSKTYYYYVRCVTNP